MTDEMPPEWMWHLDHELERWFDEISRKRKEKYGGDDDSDSDASSSGSMMTNELTRNR